LVNRVKQEIYSKPPEPNPFDFPASAKVHIVRPDETRDALLNKIRQLESRIRELEVEIKDVDGQNNELKQLLSEHENGLNSVRSQMEERMKRQQKQFLEANQQLKAHVENTKKKYEKDKLALVTDQIESTKKAVEQMLFKFDNPNSLGNRGATAEDILKHSQQLQNSYDTLLKVLENGGDTVGSTRALAEWTSKLLEDTKGAMSKITDPNVKLQLATSSRNVAREVGQILNYALTISAQNSGKADARQMEFLRGEQARFVQHLSSINSSISSSQNVLRRDPQATNLEALAEQELLNALRALGDIANSLKGQNAVRPPVSTGTLDVGATIGRAGEAIVASIVHLVSVAAASQQ